MLLLSLKIWTFACLIRKANCSICYRISIPRTVSWFLKAFSIHSLIVFLVEERSESDCGSMLILC